MKFLKIEHIERCHIRDERPGKSTINIKKWPAIINVDHIISVVPVEYEKGVEYIQIGMIHNPYRQTSFVIKMSMESIYNILKRKSK